MRSTKNVNTSGQNNSSSGESAIMQTSQTQGTPSMVQRTFRDNGQHTRSVTEGVERRLEFNNDSDD